MLIGICGSICAGKHTAAEYLVQHHNFLRLHLPTPTQLHASETRTSTSPQTCDQDHLRLLPSVTDQVGTRGLSFPDVESLLDFVTKRWREHWVLTDIFDEATLEVLLRRPFFLLVNVDAPVGVRFQRFNERYVLILYSVPVVMLCIFLCPFALSAAPALWRKELMETGLYQTTKRLGYPKNTKSSPSPSPQPLFSSAPATIVWLEWEDTNQ